MSVVGRALAPQQLPPRSKIRVGTGCSFVSLDLAGIPQWDKAVPGASPRDSSDPARKLQSNDVLLYRKLTLNCTVIVLRMFKWGPSLNFQLLDIYFILLVFF